MRWFFSEIRSEQLKLFSLEKPRGKVGDAIEIVTWRALQRDQIGVIQMKYLADPGEAKGYSTNSVDIN